MTSARTILSQKILITDLQAKVKSKDTKINSLKKISNTTTVGGPQQDKNQDIEYVGSNKFLGRTIEFR